jgi:nucleoid DNA-binding protein
MDKRVIIQKLATKYSLSFQKVEEIVFYQFKYVSKIFKEKKFESIRLPYLGKFHVIPGRLKHLQKNERSNNSK